MSRIPTDKPRESRWRKNTGKRPNTGDKPLQVKYGDGLVSPSGPADKWSWSSVIESWRYATPSDDPELAQPADATLADALSDMLALVATITPNNDEWLRIDRAKAALAAVRGATDSESEGTE